MDKLYIVIPAYNEAANIKQVIEQWHEIVARVNTMSRLIIIDDGSTDETLTIARQMSNGCAQLEVLTKKNEGHGATLLYGYECAIEAGADYIFQTDSDGQTIPEEFWRLWDEREQAGLLIGWRKKRADGFDRKIVTRVLRVVVWLNFGVWIKDPNTPFRLMRATELKQVLNEIPQKEPLANVIMSIIYKKRKWLIKFYPITFQERQGGKNSINIGKIIVMGKNAVVEFMQMRKHR